MSASISDLTERTAVVTGASAGIGAAAARELTARGATVVVVGRSPEKTAAVAAELRSVSVVADFSVLDDVRRLAAELIRLCPRIDVLAHNAGAMNQERITTVDGHEQTIQTNYLAPFLLQKLLQKRLSESRARVIVTSSIGHWMGRIHLDDLDVEKSEYSGFRAYCNSKLAALIFARELSRRYAETGMTAVAFHPGFVRTDFLIAPGTELTRGQQILERLLRVVPAEQGAAPLVHLSGIENPGSVNGKYFSKLKGDAPTKRESKSEKLGAALWATTERLLET